MTSKEAFDNIVFSKRDTENTPIKSYVSDAYRNDISEVRQALEVLEILRKHCSIKSYTPYEKPELIILSGGQITDIDEARKIKEWLENDK